MKLRCLSTLSAVVLTVGCVSGANSDQPARLCSALYSLADEVSITGQKQTSTVFKERPMEVACSAEDNSETQLEYCSAVLNEVSMEFTHAYPWMLKDCFSQKGVQSEIETRDEYTGLLRKEKIVRLKAIASDDVEVLLVFVPIQSEQAGDQLDPYWGRYELLLSKR